MKTITKDGHKVRVDNLTAEKLVRQEGWEYSPKKQPKPKQATTI